MRRGWKVSGEIRFLWGRIKYICENWKGIQLFYLGRDTLRVWFLENFPQNLQDSSNSKIFQIKQSFISPDIHSFAFLSINFLSIKSNEILFVFRFCLQIILLTTFLGRTISTPIANVWLSPVGSLTPLRQYHIQDGSGGYHYSFTGPHHAKSESSSNGITQGGKSSKLFFLSEDASFIKS